jgi:hypothetical protein
MGRARAVSCFAVFEGQRMRVRHIWELGRKIWFTECVLAQGDEEEKASDQADINAFSRLNVQMHDLDDALKEKKELLVNLQVIQNLRLSCFPFHVCSN